MTFSEQFFRKALNDLEYADIRDRLIGQPEGVESTRLEVKCWKNRTLKDFGKEADEAVAFLNISGGLLILGGPDGNWIDPQDKGKGKQFVEPFYGHDECSKDRIRAQLIDTIDPPPIGIELRPIQIPDTDQYVTIVEVPRSPHPPHQAKGAYYIRTDGEKKTAPHRIVAAMCSQQRSPYHHLYVQHMRETLKEFPIDNEWVAKALKLLLLGKRPMSDVYIMYKVNHGGAGETPSDFLLGHLDHMAVAGVVDRKLEQENITIGKQLLGSNRKYEINPDYREILEDMLLGELRD